MRTFFDIVLGILVTILKASVHALVSTAGAIVVSAVAVLGGVYLWRLAAGARSRRAAAADVLPIDR
jgi:hypothetical protein